MRNDKELSLSFLIIILYYGGLKVPVIAPVWSMVRPFLLSEKAPVAELKAPATVTPKLAAVNVKFGSIFAAA